MTDEHTKAIKAAHPLRTGNHERYARAQEMVSARHAKAELIELVNWLLMRAEAAESQKETVSTKLEEALDALAEKEVTLPEVTFTDDELRRMISRDEDDCGLEELLAASSAEYAKIPEHHRSADVKAELQRMGAYTPYVPPRTAEEEERSDVIAFIPGYAKRQVNRGGPNAAYHALIDLIGFLTVSAHVGARKTKDDRR